MVLRVEHSKSAAKAKDYFRESLQRPDYYSREGARESQRRCGTVRRCSLRLPGGGLRTKVHGHGGAR